MMHTHPLITHWPNYTPTPLVSLPELARTLGIAQVLAKDESKRPLGSFKALGGIAAGLWALMRALAARSVDELVGRAPLPRLLCASDGNHGLAVAAAAQRVGAPATIFLHEGVPAARARRIAGLGADIVTVAGTYDDAVNAAKSAADGGAGLLIADTSEDPDDPVVRDVMAGYGLMAEEIAEQVARRGEPWPTHLFVQAGVGGLAAALADGLAAHLAPPGRVVVVEPENAACVGPALAAGKPVQIAGDFETSAEMLSCGLASAPALEMLLRHRAVGMTVSERELAEAVDLLRACGGPETTPSGATGLAGLRSRAGNLGPQDRVLLIVTEGPVPTA